MDDNITITRVFQSVRNNPGWKWVFECMEDHNIWFVTQGRGVFYSNEIEIPLQRGSCLLIPPGVAGKAEQSPDAPLGTMAIHFCHSKEGAGSSLRYGIMSDPAFFETLMQRLTVSWWGKQPENALQWLGCILQEMGIMQEVEQNADNHIVAIDCLCRNIAFAPQEKWNVAEMASQTHICREHFSRIFRKYKGMSPKEFIVRSRINKAIGLIKNSDLKIYEIAFLCGYSSEHFFSRQFREVTGDSPTEFNKRAM